MRTKGYRTKTLNIAAFLYASGLQIAKIDRTNKEIYFEFVPKEDAEKLIEEYFAGTATINPRDLFARLNDLKDLIFSGGQYA